MKVVTPSGETITLGTTETKPTIGIKDFSRIVTDDFGTTVIVERRFSRKLSVRLSLPFTEADALQRRLAGLRATSARWIASDRLEWLKVQGFYKDFSIDLPTASVSFCTLTIEGLAETPTVVDGGGDPASAGTASTLQTLQPADVTETVLVSSSVAENDAPAWSASATYATGATVVRGHHIYESLVAGNVGADPLTEAAKWLDTGPTNRWAMFDGALGTSTIASVPVEAVLKPAEAVTGLALLDTNAATIRVRAPGYDRTVVPDDAGKALFLDFAAAAGASITVTATPATANPGPQHWDDGSRWMDAGVWRDSLAAGDGTVTIGTFLFGQLKGLGRTEAGPSAGIIDFSRAETDDFGEVTVVQRAWAKKMTAAAWLRTDAVDVVADRLAAVRARPALWIGQAGVDCLVVYGLAKDWSIEVGESVSKLSLSVTGMGKAAAVTPIGGGSVAWPDITDPDGTKPANGADKTSENTSKDTAAVGGTPAGEVLGRLTTLDTVTIPAVNAAVAAADSRITAARSAADAAKARADAAFTEIGSQVTRIDQRIDAVSASGGYDDSAVYAEVSRVDEAAIGRDAALGTRVDTVSASVTTTDGNLRALIQTKESAAVGREDAISRRVDQIIAEGGGGSDGVDSVARSEISRVEQASVSRDNALGTRVDNVSASIGTAVNAKAQEITTAYAAADTALANRASTLEAQMRGDAGSNLKTAITNTEAVLADLPNRYAAASRTAKLEAQVAGTDASGLNTALTARIEDRATVIADAKAGAVAQTVATLRSEYNGTAATVTQQAGTIAGFNGKLTAYVRITTDAGNGRGEFSLWSDQYGGAWALGGNGIIRDDVSFYGKLFVGVGATGQRTEITNAGVRVFDANSVLRVELGIF